MLLQATHTLCDVQATGGPLCCIAVSQRHSKRVLTRVDAGHWQGSGRRAGVLCALVLLASCAVDSLGRLGSGNDASRATDAGGGLALSGPLRADGTDVDAGIPAEPALPDPIHGDPTGSEPTNGDPVGDAGTSGAPAVGAELIPDPSFEQGHAGWMGFGSSRIFDVANARTGSRAILSTNRVETWEGPSFDIRPLVQPGGTYSFSAWVRNELDTQLILLTLKTSCNGEEEVYTRLATRAVGTGWMQIATSFFAPECAQLDELLLYVEGPPAYKNLLVDDVSLQAVSLGGEVASTDSASDVGASSSAGSSSSAISEDDQGEDED